MTKKTLLIAIILCWIFLFVCFAIKMFGGNWFEIIIKDEKLIYIGNYIDNNNWAKIIIGIISTYISIIFYYLAICSKKKFELLTNSLIGLWVIIATIIKIFTNETVSLILDGIQFLIIPYFLIGYKPRKKHLIIILAFILNLLFQIISLITKNIGIKFITNNILIALIFMIDLYIMLILFWLYSLYYKKED